MLVPEVLDSLRRRASSRFPMEISPGEPLFPLLEMDRQLLRYIFRNAVSNAIKYGLKDGVIKTIISYEHYKKLFQLQVVNDPGKGHDQLVKMSPQEVQKVFEPDTQLIATQGGEAKGHAAQKVRNESSGNGAWIMKKVSQQHVSRGLSVCLTCFAHVFLPRH